MVLVRLIECTDLINWIEYSIFIMLLVPLYFIIVKYISGKKAENLHLKQNLSDIEALINHASLISKSDSIGRITYVNNKFIEVSGYSEKELLGANHKIVNSGKHESIFWKNMYDTTITERKIWHDIVINKTKDGHLYWVDMYIKANFNPIDDSLIGFTTILQDITSLVKTVEKLNKKEKEILDVIEAINNSNLVIEFNPEGKIISANRNFLTCFKYSLDEILDKHHDMFIAPKHIQLLNKNYEKLWNDLKLNKPRSGETIWHRKDNEAVWLQATYSPISDDNGVPYKIMVIMTDITNTIKQREELDKKNTYLEHAAKILRHDMNSGINIYIPKGVRAIERRIPKEIIEEYKLEAPLKLLKDGLEHTQKIYSGIKDFTNLVKKEATLNKTNCDLRKILKSYLSKTSYSKQVIIDDLPSIEVNEALFCTAIDNLIRNGLKYNDSLNKTVHIYSEDNGKVLIVQDNGRGMTQKDFEYLSQPYARKYGQAEGGTGLGLHIFISILKEHNFSVNCEKNNTGTKIKIILDGK